LITKQRSSSTVCSTILTATAQKPEPDPKATMILIFLGLRTQSTIAVIEQIKKPREDNQGNRTPRAWTLSEACDELLPNTITNLSGNDYEQVWIVGDEVTEEVRSLLGSRSETSSIEAYFRALHLLARDEATNTPGLDNSLRRQLLRWQPPANLPTDPASALSSMTQSFREFVKKIGGPDDVADRYCAKATELDARLPAILARTKILPLYGTEHEVVKRVYDRLEQRYGLQRSVIENTLFRNLRGFINDVSKQPGRSFDQAELEFELRSVWPHMIPVKNPPPLDPNHVARPDLAERFATRWTGRAIEAVGISGSGKTMLAAEIAVKAGVTDPDRLVYYAEVRTGVSLRDVLVGVAYHLRRMNIDEPFALSVDASLTGEQLLSRLARAYSALPRSLLLLVDLVEGTCDATFARDLATFVRALSSSACRIAIFGQESALREFSQSGRDQQNLSRVDVRGFRFEEFVALVTSSHPSPDRAVLWDIYQRVTAGREAGLFAGLARALAAARSLQEMSEMAARPAEDVLAFAEQQRFARVSPSARSGAEKLVCFALPFRRKDAEEIFPNDNIGAATRELLTLGLLRAQDEDLFEMHETVRAGLESMIALSVRNAAHEALATWYGRQGVITAEILHLEKAGRPNDARARARDVFLHGQYWGSLAAYVTEHRLVTPQEVVSVMTDVHEVGDKYLFPSLLRRLGRPVDATELFEAIRRQPQRITTDYQWALAIFEAILEFNPALLDDLIRFILETASETRPRESALSSLMLAARRKHALIGPPTINFFKTAPAQTKRWLLPFMLSARSRDALHPALQFIASESQYLDLQRGASPSLGLSLQIDRKEDAIEFLASIPDVQPSEMLAARSALLGPLDGLVWPRRKELRVHCIQILKDATEQEKILESAIRILAFLGEPSICVLCEPLLTRTDRIGRFAALVPVLVPALCDQGRYEAKVLDPSLRYEDRSAALLVLAAVGADIARIYRLVRAQRDRDANAQGLDFVFVCACAQAPFADAVPLLEECLKSIDDQAAQIVVAALTRLSEMPGHEITAMCVRALAHQNPQIRQGAAIALSRRRSGVALTSLIGQYVKEDNEALAVSLASAIAASGPRLAADLQSARHNTLGIQLWQCIVATRVRDAAIADRLVELATDPTLNWQLRRAAIFATGRLPCEVALERVLPVVMQERSPLTMDGSQNFQCHEVLAHFLVMDIPGLMSIFARGRARFVAFFADIFEQNWQVSNSREGLPPGADLAGWLFDRLAHHGWPEKSVAPDRVLNELHVPILQSAVLRALRLLGRTDLIENQLPHAYHVWFAMKCLLERSRAGSRDPELNARLKRLVDASACKGNALLYRVIDQIAVPDAATAASAPSPMGSQEAPASPTLRLSYDEAVQVLSGTNPDFKPTMPLVLGPLTKEQLGRLALLAEPANDRYSSTETYIPLVSFTPNGHIVAQRRVTTTGAETTGALLRPAIAAANRFGVSIPWHQELLTGVLATTYAPRFLASLGAQDDGNRFYEALDEQVDLLLPRLCTEAQVAPVLKYIDARIVPFLQSYISSGTDEFFEGLCILARCVNRPEIDAVLSGLLHRWAQRFDITSPMFQHDQNYVLWRAFKRLADHPRFGMIEGWQSRLTSVLQAQLAWYHAQDIVRVLERDPRSYTLIESRLFRATNWQHFHQDEIDRLDAAAERLFPTLLES
jgi:HEAT repeat protein